MKISVIGAGRWGSYIAWYLDNIGHEVMLYGPKDTPQMIEFTKTRSNGLLTLGESIELVYDINRIKESDTVVISIPSQSLRGLVKELCDANIKDKNFVLCMKGIEIETGMRLSQIAEEGLNTNKVAVWIGPGHVQEFYRGVPNCMVIDSNNEELKHCLVDEFSSKLIRFYYGNDLLGNEVGAAAKNVIGIAAGMLDGYGLSSLKGALMARGAREVARLIKAMGGNELSAYGLCHLGDYEATVFSKFSHNRQFGESFVKGEKFESLAEGYYTAKAMINLSRKYSVDLPITRAVYDILYNNAEPEETLQTLFDRQLKEELV
ncbi:MAG: NAD(P)H-dependent glycerol-3-phosphate dehydrogenase [Ruminococcaceae bacterium]|nr:NAD(P)H-dependent glycerol-3-phosphate dehydrogenase [Oscillospiraceae bacterium]